MPVYGAWNVKTFLLNSKKKSFFHKKSAKNLLLVHLKFFHKISAFVYFLDAVRRFLMPPAHRLRSCFSIQTQKEKFFFRSFHLLAIPFLRSLIAWAVDQEIYGHSLREGKKFPLPWLSINTTRTFRKNLNSWHLFADK